MGGKHLIITPTASVSGENNHLKSICSVPWACYIRCALLTLVFPLPWTTTGRESYAVFLTLTRSVPNFRSTSSAKNRGNTRHLRPGYENGFTAWERAARNYGTQSLNYTDSQKFLLQNKNPYRRPHSSFEKSGTCGPRSCWEIPVRQEHKDPHLTVRGVFSDSIKLSLLSSCWTPIILLTETWQMLIQSWSIHHARG